MSLTSSLIFAHSSASFSNNVQIVLIHLLIEKSSENSFLSLTIQCFSFFFSSKMIYLKLIDMTAVSLLIDFEDVDCEEVKVKSELMTDVM